MSERRGYSESSESDPCTASVNLEADEFADSVAAATRPD